MTAYQTRSGILAVVKETNEGELKMPTASNQFTVLRQGFSVQGAVETVDSDELVNDIGATEGFVTRETPTANVPKYFKHSGVEGQAPDYAVMIESAMGSVRVNGTERATTAGSTAGTGSARANLKLAAGGEDFPEGTALLIKDGANGYAIRNSMGNTGNDVPLNYNIAAAPAAGVKLGKAVHFAPVATGHPTYSLHQYQAAAQSSGFHQAIAGCRTTGMNVEFPANDLGSITFDIEGVRFFENPIEITSTNNKIDFDLGGEDPDALVATLSSKIYKSPKELAREVATKMTAAAGEAIECAFDSTTGKFRIDGSISLRWNTGANKLSSAGPTLGYSAAADDTGSTSYTADNALGYGPAVEPTYDDVKANVVKANELLIGDFARNDVRKFSNVSLSISTPKTDVIDGSSESGVDGSVVLERTVEMTTTLVFKKHESDLFDAMINNATTQAMFNSGQKVGGNWVPGTCVNVWLSNAKVTSNVLSDSDGLVVREVTLKGFVSASRKDAHLNLV